MLKQNIEYNDVSPHIRTKQTTTKIMGNVIIAMLFPLAGAVWFFGIRSLVLVLAGAVACVITEYIWQRSQNTQVSVKDLSALVTGMLIAFNFPVTTPVWIIVAASVFAILIVKQFFGGIGSNFMNPALAGRAFVMLLWPGKIINYILPGRESVDAVTSPTVLGLVKSGETNLPYSIGDMFVGNIPGAIGETSKILLIIGFVYLCCKKIVNIKTTLAYIGTVLLITWVFGPQGLFTGDILTNLFSGGLLLGAFFMITDYSFATASGKLLMGIIAGIITGCIRSFGTYPEGVCYGILLANCIVGFVEKNTKRHIYGMNILKTSGNDNN